MKQYWPSYICHDMASLGYNMLTQIILVWEQKYNHNFFLKLCFTIVCNRSSLWQNYDFSSKCSYLMCWHIHDNIDWCTAFKIMYICNSTLYTNFGIEMKKKLHRLHWWLLMLCSIFISLIKFWQMSLWYEIISALISCYHCDGMIMWGTGF